MKKLHFRRVLPCCAAIVALFCVVACGRKQVREVEVKEGTFLIEGRVANVPDGAVVFLLRDSGGKMLEKVTCDTLTDGRFTLTDTVTRQTRYLLSCVGEQWPNALAPVWADDGERIEITGEDRDYALWTVTSRVARQAEENRYTEAVREPLRGLMYVDTLPSEQRVRRYMELSGEFVAKTVDYMMTSEVDDFWMDKWIEIHGIWRSITTRPSVDWERLADRMSDEQRTGEKGRVIESLVHPVKKVSVGERMPETELSDIEGRRRSLKEFARRYILLEFWSAGCYACSRAVPELEEAAARYGSRLAVVGISVDDRDNWVKAVSAGKTVGEQWIDMTALGKSLPVRCGADEGVPCFVLIAPTGKVADMWMGYTPGVVGEKLSRYL